MKSRSKIGLGLVLGIVFGLPLGTVYNVVADKSSSLQPLPLEELRTFSDVYARIKNDYVEDVDDKTLIQNAIRGMLSGLDPHSTYLDIDEFRDLQIGTTGEFGGLGIEVGMEDGFVKVISPIDDTPAQKAGVEAGDLIIRLDEKPVKGMTLSDAVDIMRGKRGTIITLTIIREGEDKPLKIDIKRDVIRVESVKSRTLEEGYGYFRISTFQSKTSKSLNDAIKTITEENGGTLKGAILDLRNNPGGVLTGAVGVSDSFLKEGLIVYTEGRVPDSQLRYDATPGDKLDGIPLIVLVNAGSASASEIVAGALQDHKRAIIVGSDNTFGKGSVQTILPLKEDNALKLTTARYYTPSGRSIQAEGIEPDIMLERIEIKQKKKQSFDPVKESSLSGHLMGILEKEAEEAKERAKEAGDKGEKSSDTTKIDSDTDDDKPLSQKDFELYQALNLLKGLSILGKI
ncbi:MAG TPA: peptidase S41 [Gammaproteobacteria bacterium]|jgi:carboxyl-terminal processing protease|nr:peptidase S41 [Gammaproteobacteria bacterium]